MPGWARRPLMSLRSAKLSSDPGYDQPFLPVHPASVRALDNKHPREAKRFPAIIVARHLQPPCTGGDYDAERIPCAEQVVPNSKLVVPSPVSREEQTVRDLATELQKIVRQAAGPISPGMSIKSQQNAACDNLGYKRGDWRVRSAWYGYAGNWTGRAVFEMLDRYHGWSVKVGAQPAAANDPASSLRSASGASR